MYICPDCGAEIIGYPKILDHITEHRRQRQLEAAPEVNTEGENLAPWVVPDLEGD